MEHGADPNLTSADGKTALTIAMRDNMLDVITLLRTYGALEPSLPQIIANPGQPFAESFNQALRSPVEIRNLTVTGMSVWRWGLNLHDQLNYDIQLLREDFAELSRCDISNMKTSDRAHVEVSSLIFITEDNGPVYAISPQYPGHIYRDVEVQGSSELRTSVLSTAPPTDVVGIVYEYLRRNRKSFFGRNVPREFKRKRRLCASKVETAANDARSQPQTSSNQAPPSEPLNQASAPVSCETHPSPILESSMSPSRSQPASW